LSTKIERVIPYKPSWKENSIQSPINVFLGIFSTFLLLHILYSIFASGNGVDIGYLSSMSGTFNIFSMVFSFASISSMNKLDSMGWSYDELINADPAVDQVKIF
jgi:hypothetical protein